MVLVPRLWFPLPIPCCTLPPSHRGICKTLTTVGRLCGTAEADLQKEVLGEHILPKTPGLWAWATFLPQIAQN